MSNLPCGNRQSMSWSSVSQDDPLLAYIASHPARAIAAGYMFERNPTPRPSDLAEAKLYAILGWDAAMASMGQKVPDVSPYKQCPKST